MGRGKHNIIYSLSLSAYAGSISCNLSLPPTPPFPFSSLLDTHHHILCRPLYTSFSLPQTPTITYSHTSYDSYLSSLFFSLRHPPSPTLPTLGTGSEDPWRLFIHLYPVIIALSVLTRQHSVLTLYFYHYFCAYCYNRVSHLVGSCILFTSEHLIFPLLFPFSTSYFHFFPHFIYLLFFIFLFLFFISHLLSSSFFSLLSGDIRIILSPPTNSKYLIESYSAQNLEINMKKEEIIIFISKLSVTGNRLLEKRFIGVNYTSNFYLFLLLELRWIIHFFVVINYNYTIN